MKPPEKPAEQNPGREDARADRLTFFWVAGFFAAFLLVDILSLLTEKTRFNLEIDPAKYALYEASSIVVILGLYPLMRIAAGIAAPGENGWPKVIGIHILGSIVFSGLHIALMVAIRKAAFPPLFGGPYIFTDNLLREVIYEYRKDMVSYALIVFLITFGRQLAQQRRELTAAREEARKSSRLTLKCGGRTVFMNAADVVWVKSASNYVEVMAGGAPQLARATLASVERQLADAGAPAIRVHRSWIVNPDRIVRIEPTGEGDVRIQMTDGTLVPGSRRHREKLTGMP